MLKFYLRTIFVFLVSQSISKSQILSSSDVEKFFDNNKTGINPVVDKAALSNLVVDVEFENVFFRYPQRAQAKILKGLYLRLHRKVDRVTLSYHTKVYENVSNHIDCYNNCLKTLKCVALEIYDGKCFLFDKNFKMSYNENSTSYFVNKVDLSICDCECKDAKEKGLDFGSEYNEKCIKNKEKNFKCILKKKSCDTELKPDIQTLIKPVTLYNHKEEHEIYWPICSCDKVRDYRDYHGDCSKICLHTKTFKCVASEMNKGICYLYDDSYKTAYDEFAKSYFVEQPEISMCDCKCLYAIDNGLNYGSEYKKKCIEEKSEIFTCILRQKSC